MPWYCLTTRPQSEILCAESLYGMLGYQALVPVDYKLRRRSPITNTAVVYPVPVMPRYVVVDLEEHPNWYKLRNVEVRGRPAVTSVLSMDEEPYPLPALAVAAVKSMIDERLVVPLAPGLRVGDTAIIEGGQHAGKRAKVKRVIRPNLADVSMLLTFFGSLHEVQIKSVRVSADNLSECGEKAAA